MELKLNNNDRFRVYADHDRHNFIDIKQENYDGMSVDLYCSLQIIEMRKKENVIRIFLHHTKEQKEECDYGWWSDAEILFISDSVIKHL